MKGVGVDEATEKSALALSAVEGPVRVEVDGLPRPLCVVAVDGMLRAVEDRCPHLGARLSRGTSDGVTVRCPLHGLRVDVRTGHVSGIRQPRMRTYVLQSGGPSGPAVWRRANRRPFARFIADLFRLLSGKPAPEGQFTAPS
jgi:nitrite reductase/ring-hydroxylating ferredoxin subunit